jgi:hypothetical protein
MRRVQRVHAAFEPTRCSEEQQLAYEQVLPTVRRMCVRRDDNSWTTQRADEQPRSVQRKVAP